MDQQNVENLFTWFDQMVEIIQRHEDMPYLDSLVEAGELLFVKQVSEEVEAKFKSELEAKLAEINMDHYEREEVRKGLQLAILKGMKGVTQQHHYITPDTVAIFMGYLLSKFMKNEQQFTIFDPACGTGNLLTAVLNQLKQKVQATGSEVDSTLIHLAYVNANLQEREIEFHHQDSLGSFLVEPQDVIVSDVPVGYYPDDQQARKFELRNESEHSFAHHLFIEQSLRYTKPGGYVLLLVPAFIFNEDNSDKLHGYIQEHAHIQGVLQLPDSMFQNEQNAKCIFVLQKKGDQTKPPKKVLMAQLPSFKDVKAMDKTLNHINVWFDKDR
ncbi:class I SAM-dependent methyltransferase [Salirhabdus sp. Marseille-P4669]|uniref:class I SAM-dependent methyltransferase n=1 Tax=Salirhabdus sp. Marseille-P4669 TaxID=2042310 RepID=UPI000C7E766B|nr:class I SAM-dependent methyltransferase [Salirhabdus sp. Marseille-P4669]